MDRSKGRGTVASLVTEDDDSPATTPRSWTYRWAGLLSGLGGLALGWSRLKGLSWVSLGPTTLYLVPEGP